MSSITLITSSGKWRRTVKRDDPIFSSLIPDLDDLPDELTLPGSVGEILDEEWKYYEMIESTHAKVRSREIINSVIFRAKSNVGDLTLPSAVTTVVSQGGSIVPHSKVARLCRLLDLPSHVSNYIYLDEGVPQRDRIAHLRTIAARTYDWMVLGFDSGLVAVVRGAIIQCEHSSKNGLEEWCKFLIAQYYEAELRSFSEGRNVSVYDVNWEDTLVVLKEWETTHLLEGEDLDELRERWLYAFELATILTNGERKTDYIIGFPLRTMVIPHPKIQYNSLEAAGVSDSDLCRLYRSDLSYHESDCEPGAIGLSLITGDLTWASLGVVGIVNGAIAHYVWISVKGFVDMRKKMPRTLFPQLVETYGMTIVGREGLRKILLSLLHYLVKETADVKKVRRINYFCSLVEKYLKKEPVEMMSALPKAEMVPLVMERLKK